MKWEPIDTFDIDNDELAGFTPVECFVLGVEWQMVRTLADKPEPFTHTVHSANRDRLAALIARRKRDHTFTFMPDDKSESWMILTCGPGEVAGE